jgi:hypothetical protein
MFRSAIIQYLNDYSDRDMDEIELVNPELFKEE